jgi:hypothetical protein
MVRLFQPSLLMPRFEPQAVPYTKAAWLPPSTAHVTLRVYCLDVFETHLRHVHENVGPAVLGSAGLEHKQDGEALGAWLAVADDGRILFFQTPFRKKGRPQAWTDVHHSIAASRAFDLTVGHFGGREIENSAATDKSWERYIGNLLKSEANLTWYEELVNG